MATFDPRAAKALEPGSHIVLAAHPGLRLVATETRRTWVYRYRHPESGLMKQMRLGAWPAVSASEAVEKWHTARGERSKGVDVGAAARAKRTSLKAEATARRRRETLTVGRLVEQYLDELVDRNRKSKGALETRRLLESAVASIKARPAEDLTREEAHELVLDIAARAPRVAAMTRTELRAAWEHAASVGRLNSANPFAGKSIGGRIKATSRDRVLDAREAGALLRWMREPSTYSRTVADALELTLRTGLRSGEVAGIHTNELQERSGVLWLDIPGSRMKAEKPHAVPLVGRAAEIVIARMPPGGGWLFPSRDGEKPIEQKVLGVEVYACSGRSKAAAYKARRVCPVAGWAPHDLRRTARTMLAELGCPFEVGEAILAHALPGVAGVYNRAAHEAAKTEWLLRLNAHLDALAAAENVVALRRVA